MGLTLVDFGQVLLQIIKDVILVTTGVIMVMVKRISVDQSVELLHKDGKYNLSAYWISETSSDYSTQYYNIFSRYHIPRSVLKYNGNTLVLFDEFGGDPSNVSIQTVATGKVCGNAAENTTLVLSCEDKMLQKVPPGLYAAATGKIFTEVNFASFGNANGTCGTVPQPYQKGTCDYPNTLAAVKKVYLSTYFKFLHRYLEFLVTCACNLKLAGMHRQRIMCA